MTCLSYRHHYLPSSPLHPHGPKGPISHPVQLNQKYEKVITDYPSTPTSPPSKELIADGSSFNSLKKQPEMRFLPPRGEADADCSFISLETSHIPSVLQQPFKPCYPTPPRTIAFEPPPLTPNTSEMNLMYANGVEYQPSEYNMSETSSSRATFSGNGAAALSGSSVSGTSVYYDQSSSQGHPTSSGLARFEEDLSPSSDSEQQWRMESSLWTPSSSGSAKRTFELMDDETWSPRSVVYTDVDENINYCSSDFQSGGGQKFDDPNFQHYSWGLPPTPASGGAPMTKRSRGGENSGLAYSSPLPQVSQFLSPRVVQDPSSFVYSELTGMPISRTLSYGVTPPSHEPSMYGPEVHSRHACLRSQSHEGYSTFVLPAQPSLYPSQSPASPNQYFVPQTANTQSMAQRPHVQQLDACALRSSTCNRIMVEGQGSRYEPSSHLASAMTMSLSEPISAQNRRLNKEEQEEEENKSFVGTGVDPNRTPEQSRIPQASHRRTGSGYTPSQAALISATSMNRLLAARGSFSSTPMGTETAAAAAVAATRTTSSGNGNESRATSSPSGKAVTTPPANKKMMIMGTGSFPARYTPPGGSTSMSSLSSSLSSLSSFKDRRQSRSGSSTVSTVSTIPSSGGSGGSGSGSIGRRYEDDFDDMHSQGVMGSSPNSNHTKLHLCLMEGCEKAFKRLEHLKRHERTHTLEKPFACDVDGCGRHFSRADNLTQHKKTHDKANHRAKEKALAAEARAPAMSSMTGEATKTKTVTSVAATAAVIV